ncbi:MAG: hypothetical protein KatS3mg027_2667 [Bacteroidia bacterium]|nr:MAG: hypothetical protein KatS3mg027_2667 [Bacteroidia bacterium]
MEGRNLEITNYRFGFQGQEGDDEVFGKDNLWAYKYRLHDARLGRFFSVDPLAGKYPFYSMYQFSGNRVIDMVELEGLEPGIPFNSATEAALNFGKYYGVFSIIENREYSATIYVYMDKDGKTKYTYNNPKRGTKSGAPPNRVKKREGKAVAGIHSHGAYDYRYDNNNFSPDDINFSENEGVPEYITTPSGLLKKYDPVTEEVSVISEDLPSDPSDPEKRNTNHAMEEEISKKERNQKIKEYRKIRKEFKKEYRKILKERE